MTTADELARACRGMDHIANTAPDHTVRGVAIIHRSAAVLLLGILEDPSRADLAAAEWAAICRGIIRATAEEGLADMAPYYAAEQARP